MSNAEPGWYPQPDGTQRYWTGQEWAPADFAPAVDQASAQPDETTKPDAGRGVGIGCLGIIAVIAALWIAGSIFGDDDSGGSGADDKYGAIDVCEQFVERRLKSPSTADFNDTKAVEASGVWTVTGSVDSENSFGAEIRNAYVCKTRSATGENWTLVDLQMTEN